ncbi:hypothetical protein QYF36_003715 [Acer negundo]|nr:hypothetical protein QYF36_003715 [Acer negundo]
MDVNTEWYSFHFHCKATPTPILQTVPTCLSFQDGLSEIEASTADMLSLLHQVLGSIPGLLGRTLAISDPESGALLPELPTL